MAFNPFGIIKSALEFVNPGNVIEAVENMFLPNQNAQKYQRENNEFNSNEARLQRDWSSQESETDRNFNAQQAQLQRDFSTSEREAQQVWQEEMMNKQNEYNLPANQIKLMREAGLSPSMFDGSVSSAASPTGVPSGANTGAASAGGSRSGAVGSSGASPSLVASWLGAIPSLMAAKAQTRLLDAQAKAVEGQEERAKDEHPLKLDLLGMELQIGNFNLSEMLPSERDKLKAETDSVRQSIKESVSRIDLNKAYTDLYTTEGKLKQNELDHWEEQFYKNLAEQDSRISVNRAQVKEAYQRIAESIQKIHLMQKEGAMIDEQIKGQIIQNGLAGLEFDVQYRTHSKRLKFVESDMDNKMKLAEYDVQTEGYAAKVAGNKDTLYLDYLEALVSALGYPLGAGISVNKKLR